MIPLAAVLLAVGFTRLMATERLAALDPLRAAWRRQSPRIADWIRRAPATYTYLFVLLVTTWVLSTSSSAVARQLLLERSTNLHELSQDPVRVLVASAFFVTNAPEWFFWVVLFTLVAAPVEQRIGSSRAGAVFGLGHVGATLLTASGLWIALRSDLVESSVVSAVDVGASYGFVALAGIAAFLLPVRLRLGYVGAALGVLVLLLASGPSFTDFGHVLALCIGLACRSLVPADVRPSAG